MVYIWVQGHGSSLRVNLFVHKNMDIILLQS